MTTCKLTGRYTDCDFDSEDYATAADYDGFERAETILIGMVDK
jgi:hypothetical protein